MQVTAHNASLKMKINKRGQITIPWLLRIAANYQPGDECEVRHIGPGRLEIQRLTAHWPPGFAEWQARQATKTAAPLPSPAVFPNKSGA